MTKKYMGLTSKQVIEARQKHGDNSLIKEKNKSYFKKFIENLSDPIIKVLLLAVAVEIIFTFGHCNIIETGGIILAVLIATVVSTVSEYGSEQAFKKMQEADAGGAARVWRDGILQTVSPDDLVVGDAISLTEGENIYADGRMVEGRITVDQSALNGESRDAEKFSVRGSKKEDLSFEGRVFRGSAVTGGSGIYIVERVGGETYYGMVAKDVQSETRTSPLKLRLSHLASQISLIGYIMAAIVGLTYLFFTFVADTGFDMKEILNSFKNIPFVVTTLAHALTLMITVVVVAVPEGLPMMITVVLSANMKKMLKDNIMIKKLVGIETAGSMNILFTDKTGTLTTGKTSVFGFVTQNGFIKGLNSLKESEKIYTYLRLSAVQNTADVKAGNNINSTERALSDFFEKDGVGYSVESYIPFSSEKKYSAVNLKNGETVIKGAPELILSTCEYAYVNSGETVLFNKDKIYREYTERATRGERIIGVAVKNPEKEGLIFVALIVLKDKIRSGARGAVEKIKSAGVQVVMITGDSKETASAIASECGILRSSGNEKIISHDELAAMSDEELKKIIPNLRIVARALPQDKTRLVRVSQELNLVVGMTGDGINDAPALKLADIGFAMGSGTDIAKGAGDIVILDDSIFAISKTILYGRTIFKSIRKFISFQLMMNLTACGVSLIGQFIGIETPITIIQMLWINIIMDTLGGLAFSGEPPLDYYMMEKPKSREEKILSKDMLHQIFLTGGYTLLLSVSFLNFDFFKSLFRDSAGDTVFMTGFYALFVFSGIFNCFNSRSERMWLFSNIGKNKPFLLIMTAISVIQIGMVYYGGNTFRTAPLSFREFLNVILIASSVVIFDLIRRIFKKLSK